MRLPNDLQFRAQRTNSGYLVVARVAGVEVGRAHVTDDEVLTAMGHDPNALAQVGFSFAAIAKSIKSAATKIGKLKVLGQLAQLATQLPPPVGTVATMARQAVDALHRMATTVGPVAQQARAAWDAAAAIARQNPQSPHAVALRLAMDTYGRPRMAPAAHPPESPAHTPPSPPEHVPVSIPASSAERAETAELHAQAILAAGAEPLSAEGLTW